jgi:hypothetical protein
MHGSTTITLCRINFQRRPNSANKPRPLDSPATPGTCLGTKHVLRIKLPRWRSVCYQRCTPPVLPKHSFLLTATRRHLTSTTETSSLFVDLFRAVLELEVQGSTTVRNVANVSTREAALRPTRHESSAEQLWERQTSPSTGMLISP